MTCATSSRHSTGTPWPRSYSDLSAAMHTRCANARWTPTERGPLHSSRFCAKRPLSRQSVPAPESKRTASHTLFLPAVACRANDAKASGLRPSCALDLAAHFPSPPPPPPPQVAAPGTPSVPHLSLTRASGVSKTANAELLARHGASDAFDSDDDEESLRFQEEMGLSPRKGLHGTSSPPSRSGARAALPVWRRTPALTRLPAHRLWRCWARTKL